MQRSRKFFGLPLAVPLAPAPALGLPMLFAFHAAVLGAAIAWQSLLPGGAAALLREPRTMSLPWWAAAIGVSWILVLGPALLETHVPALQELGRELYHSVAPITGLRVAAFAGLAGICEEALFRGPVQATLGWPLAALLFGLLHGGFAKRLRVWTMFALAAGGLFGILVEVYDSLSPAIVAHITVNAINMRRLARHAPRKGPF